MTFLRTLLLWALWFLCLSIGLVAWRFIPLGVEAMGFVAYHAEVRPLAFYTHVGLAPVAMILMPFQFLRGWRARWPALHRWTGRVYATAILLAGLAGLMLALGTDAGPVAAMGFASMAVLWVVSTAIAVWMAKAGDFTAHRRWMIRSAALTFAAVTLRLELPLLMIGGMEQATAYSTVAWSCWMLNLMVAEWLLRARWAEAGAGIQNERQLIERGLVT